MDKIIIEALECKARVGVPEAEREQPQRIVIDIELSLDLKEAGRSDSMTQTLDYAAVAERAKQICASKPFLLVEALAESIADALLLEFRPKELRLRARKFSVPGAASVGVEITRKR